MIKKIVLGVLLLGLIAALVAGAVNRTIAKSDEGSTAERHGAGWTQAEHEGLYLAENTQGRGGQGGGYQNQQSLDPAQGSGWRGGGRNGTAEQARANSTAQGNQTYGNRQGAGPIAETESHDWTTLTGTVTSVDDTQMTVQTDSGEIEVADRPWSFALSAGFTAQVGDQVTLEGFYQDGIFETGRLLNGDLAVSIREESGRPLWAGRGWSRNW